MPSTADQQQNADKARRLAHALYPDEEWVEHENGIYVAKSRLHKGHKAQSILSREISDVRLLAGHMSAAYFLPDRHETIIVPDADMPHMHPDTVIDGAVVELKSITGNRETLGKAFRRGYKQGRSLLKNHGINAEHSVFLRLYTPFTVESVRAKLAGELKIYDDAGYAICYFEATGALYYWPYSELKSILTT
jgi:hypothetical protein